MLKYATPLSALLLTSLLNACILPTSSGFLPVGSGTGPTPSPLSSASVKPSPIATALPTAMPTATALPSPVATASPSSPPINDKEIAALNGIWQIIDAPNAGASNWALEEGQLIQTSNTYRTDDEYTWFEGTHAILKGANLQDFQLKATITPTDNDGFGVLFRYQDENNFYRLISVQDSSNKGPFTRFQVKQSGVYKTLTEDPRPLAAETLPVQIMVTASGSQFIVKINGVEWFNVSDPSFSTGRAGLVNYACQMKVSAFEYK